MVPPGDRKYFFSVVGKQICAKDHPKVSIREIQEIMFMKDQKAVQPITKPGKGGVAM